MNDDFLAPPVLRVSYPLLGVACEPNVVLSGVEIFEGVSVGLHSYMNGGMLRPSSSLGRYCSVGRRVTVGTARHPTDWLTSHPFVFRAKYSPDGLAFASRSTTIGNDVWIGDNASIMEGVTIGDGAIIGTSAVVTHDVQPYAIVAGIPARVLRYRFPEAIIRRLHDLRWWQYHPKHLVRIPFHSIDAAIGELEQLGKSSNAILLPCFKQCFREDP